MADSEESQAPPPEQGGESDAAREGAPTDEELRAQLEEEIRQVRVEDVVLQGAVSILNLAARRIAKEDERDLEQARVGIEAARALTELVPEQAQPQLRQAVAELQLMYAKHAGEDDAAGGEGGGQGPDTPKGPGGSGLWTPSGSGE
ncbi:MAG TPA: hypothetical protein VHH72_01740 [Solirubrobacterales bacterium]|jgi:hypothetical protein|nr:hypothetical protein [Solirubrobacterales bacterium]